MGWQESLKEPEFLAEEQLLHDLEKKRISHAYLFLGSDLERKQKIASFFIQALVCNAPQNGKPCGHCYSCHALAGQGHPDVHIQEAEQGSIKIDQIRAWQSFFGFRPLLGRNQVFVLKAPERLTLPAANSLLKILEEPLPQTIFLLLTEDDRSLLATIISRCRLVFFRDLGSSSSTIEKNAGSSFYEILSQGSKAELLREIRLLGNDRQKAVSLLSSVARNLEYFKHFQQDTYLTVLECLNLLLKGQQDLESNLYVPLVLVTTLSEVQKRLQALTLRKEEINGE